MFRFSRRAVIFLLTFSLVITSFLSHGLMQADAVTGTSIVYGKDAIAKALKKGDKLYFGQVASGYTGLNLWRVGNPSGSNTGDGNAIFLLSEYTWRGPGNSIVFNADYEKAAAQTWEGSDAQKWCQNFYAANFSSSDKSHIVSYNKTEAEGNWLYINFGANNITSKDKVFFLSAEEVWRYLGTNSASKELRTTDINGTPTAYWLRSPRADNRYQVGEIDGVKGGVATDRVDRTQILANGVVQDYTARPAVNINTKDLLLISGTGSKNGSVGTMNNVLYNSSEFKLTYLDPARRITAGSCTNDGSRITVNFSDATTGNSNDYVSAIIEKNGKASYYGKFAQNKANGTISFPSNLMGQGSELYIFSERCNGDYKTDYASSFVKVAVPEYIPPKTDIKKTTAAVNAPSLAVNVKAYKPKSAKKAVTVKWKKATKNIQRKISGYQVQIASSPDFSNAKTYKASKKVSSKRIKKLSKRTKYYVRVRAYKGAACGAWSKVKTVKTK